MVAAWSIRLLLVATLCAAASLSIPLRAASADDRMEWQFSEFNDPDNKGRTTVRLTFGVPETDAIQVSGVCDATSGTSANFSSVTFGADVGKLENGKQVDLRFSGGGFDHVLQGQVHRAAGEEGLSGVNLAIGAEDPLWRAMADSDSLDYLVPGFKASTLSFERGKDKIQQFLQACRTYAEHAAPQRNDQATSQPADAGGSGAEKEAFNSAKELGTIEAWNAFLASYPTGFHADLARAYIKTLDAKPSAPMQAPEVKASTPVVSAGDVSCEQLSQLRSQNSDTPTKITFVNNSGGHRAILWLDFTGQPKEYASLNTGQEVTLDTFLTHPWMVTDGPGNCLQIVMPSPGGRVVELGHAERGHASSTAAPKPHSVKKGCAAGSIVLDGKCILAQDAAGYCGPGFRVKGSKCVRGSAKATPQTQPPSWQAKAIKKGCKPGQDWNAAEGCHEND